MNHECNHTPAPSGPAGKNAGPSAADTASAGATATATVRVDLHCHSSASAGGPLRPGAVPECATPPQEVYELAKRRGMDFVTITDHDTIDGVLQVADEPDAFISEELTVRFPDEPRAVHVLCYGITPDDHGRLQELRGDVIVVAEYLHEHEIACSLAHPFWNAEAPLTPAHRRLLARLFGVWETRNGKRPTVINAPAAIYIDTHGGGATGGSDDHSGTETGRTFTQAPAVATPGEFLAHIRAGATSAHGAEGSPAKTAHAALALAARTPGQPSAAARSWLHSVELELDTGGLVAQLQGSRPGHAELERRARRIHELRLARAVGELRTAGDELTDRRIDATLTAAAEPAMPYIRARASLYREQANTLPTEDAPVRVAVVADGLGGLRGAARMLDELRELGLPGYEIDLIGTDSGVDRRLASVREVELPFLPGVTVGIPSLFAVAEVLVSRRYDLIHVATAGPAGHAAAMIGAAMGIPVLGGDQTELPGYAALYCQGSTLPGALSAALAGLYARCRLVLSPSAVADEALAGLGVGADRIARWQPGVDLERFNPAQYAPDCLPDHGGGRFNVLYAGRLAREKGIDLLAEAFQIARDRDPRLHLVLAGTGPRERALRSRLGPSATFLGWVAGDALAQLYASADLFVYPGSIDGYGRAVLEAQASGLPVLAATGSGACEQIESGRTGCVVEADAQEMASAIRWLARRAAIRERLATGGLLAVRRRSWDGSLQQLAGAYAVALAGDHAAAPEVPAARAADAPKAAEAAEAAEHSRAA